MSTVRERATLYGRCLRVALRPLSITIEHDRWGAITMPLPDRVSAAWLRAKLGRVVALECDLTYRLGADALTSATALRVLPYEDQHADEGFRRIREQGGWFDSQDVLAMFACDGDDQ